MKEMLVTHVEKAVVAVCGLVFILFVVQAAQLETYDRTPEDFSTATQRAKKNVETAEPEEVEIADLKKINEELRAPVKADEYNFLTAWRRAFDFGENFRKRPRILTPNQPAAQANRGLIPIYKTDFKTGERITRKVKKSEARFIANAERDEARMSLFQSAGMAAPGAGMGMDGMGMGGMGMGGMDMAGMGMDMSAMEMGGVSGMGMPMGGMGDYDVGGYGMGGYGMEGLMVGNEGMYALPGDEMGMGMDFNPEPQPKAVTDRKRRTIVDRDILAGDEKDKDAKKEKKSEKDEVEVEEYVIDMVGRHWVEVLAAFPHSDQVREYVEALREPAQYVGLRYALAEVQRRELDENNEWTRWKPIELTEQFNIVQNALAFEPEIYGDVVMKGLCMNIPMLQTTYKALLTLPEFEEPERAEYEERYRDPRMWEYKQQLASKPKKQFRRPRPQIPEEARKELEEKKKKKEEEQQKRLLAKGARVQKLEAGKDDEKNVKAKLRERFDNKFYVKDAMIRFWDFTVVPGRRYQYRVRVRAYNPNYKRDDVADPAFAVAPFLVGDWSEPTSEVYVEPDVQWYAADPRTTNRTDVAEFKLHYWSRSMGEWITNETAHRPGEVIGLSGISRENTVVEWDDIEKEWVPKAVNLFAERNFDTRDILLSIDGGFTRDDVNNQVLVFRRPKEIVTINEYGDLVRRDSYSDVNDPIRSAIDAGYEDLVKELKSYAQPATPAGGAGGPGEPADPLDPLAR